MTKPTPLSTMLTVAGGLAAAILPATARANCNPSPTSSTPPSNIGNPTTASEPTIDLRARAAEGMAAYNAGDFKTARIAFDSMISFLPANATIHYMAGAARIGLGDYKGARKRLTKALKLAPDMLLAKQDLGVAYAKLGERALAEQMLKDLQARHAACAGTCADEANLASAVETLTRAMA